MSFPGLEFEVDQYVAAAVLEALVVYGVDLGRLDSFLAARPVGAVGDLYTQISLLIPIATTLCSTSPLKATFSASNRFI